MLIIDDASIQKNEDNKYIFINNSTLIKETDDPFESTARKVVAAYLSKSKVVSKHCSKMNALQNSLLNLVLYRWYSTTEKC